MLYYSDAGGKTASVSFGNAYANASTTVSFDVPLGKPAGSYGKCLVAHKNGYYVIRAKKEKNFNSCSFCFSAKKTEQFIKAVKKLDKRQDEFHDSNFTALAYTSDGDVYHIKTDVGEYSENDIAIEGARYKGTENIVRLLEK